MANGIVTVDVTVLSPSPRLEEKMRELMEPLANGMPRCSVYLEYLRILDLPDDGASFAEWSRVASLIIGEPAGNA